MIDTLSFIQALLTGHHPTVFHPHAQVLVPAVIAAVSDTFYKISSEALVVLQLLVKVLRPLDSSPTTFDFTLYTSNIYQCCFLRLKEQDIDQEVKERAISCMGQVVAHLGDSLQAELSSCLPIFLERLRNEITRLTAVKALIAIASSPLRIDLRCILKDSLPVLSSFLRKNQRALKLSTLVLLDTLVKNYPGSLDLATLSPVLAELPPLVSETDLHIAQLTLALLTSVTSSHASTIPVIQKSILPEVLKLAESPLLQGAALAAMLDFFRALVGAGVPGLSHSDMLALLVNPILTQKGAAIHKQGRANIAKCAASLVSHSQTVAVVKQFMQQLNPPGLPDYSMTFSLLAIGETGRGADLSQVPDLKTAILAAFNHSSEEVKSAASYALGNIALGNLKEYLPFILHEIQTQPRRQYLLLHSLKEVISAQSSSPSGIQTLSSYVPSIWDQLYRLFNSLGTIETFLGTPSVPRRGPGMLSRNVSG